MKTPPIGGVLSLLVFGPLGRRVLLHYLRMYAKDDRNISDILAVRLAQPVTTTNSKAILLYAMGDMSDTVQSDF